VGTGGIIINGNRGGSVSTAGSNASAAGRGTRPAAEAGCNCGVKNARGSGIAALAALALGVSLLRRRRAA
jgi:MYXO-CTERM domain-containing protein